MCGGTAEQVLKVCILWLTSNLKVEVFSPERDEAKVGSIEKAPALPLAKEHGPAADVRDHDGQAQGDGHGDRVDRLLGLVGS